ncbi:MAG: glycogen debranching protein GlgX [Chthoniobacterales bacterium]|nr:glycogen debranching protein GlgX [Chthoniobacterales bacterium]
MRKRLEPTHEYGNFRLRYGHPLPFGASHVPEGINFSVYSKHATACTLVLFERGAEKPLAEIPFPPEFKLGDVFAMIVYDLEHGQIEYGYRFDGPKEERSGLIFDQKNICLDPYAQEIGGRDVWLKRPGREEIFPHRGRIPREEYDWGHDRPLLLPSKDLIIYEMHVRGFTRHPSSKVKYPGTFAGMMEKIPYLQELGVNCVELMPIFEFDEWENPRTNPTTGEQLCNYWGYSTVGFFAPKSGYAARGHMGGQLVELKELIRALHDAKISVILDVVFNHTAEGGNGGPVISFKGIDNKTYYMLNPDGSYVNYSGCGNTVNCNHPVVRGFVLDCLRYWAAEYHIDGFRFDLASVLGRGPDGTPLHNPPLLEALAYDPVLSHCELIAEAWDAGGLYQVGSFPSYGRWSEWNGKFRDCARRFLRGDQGTVGEMVQRIMGSPDLYQHGERSPQSSINFITCHDGFTLLDLFSYSQKYNLENGENNADGANENLSWNCGVEGPTNDASIKRLRLQLRKNAIALLMMSQGIPMIYMGDECGRTQRGNNNAYCHDAEWNWFDWSLCEIEREMLEFTKKMIAFRKAHPVLRATQWLTGRDLVCSGYPDISWHGVLPWKPDWSYHSQSLAFMLCGRHARRYGDNGNFLYAAFNSWREDLDFYLPVLPRGMKWHLFVDTSKEYPDDIIEPGQEVPLSNQKKRRVRARSCIILVGK